MKVLLISNVPEDLDNVVSALDFDGAVVVTKEFDSSIKDMAKKSRDLFTQGNYDMIVALTDNPIAANIAFNKLDNTTAAVCDSYNDAQSARDNDANVIVVKNYTQGATDIINAVIKKPGMFRSSRTLQMPKAQKAPKQSSQKQSEDYDNPPLDVLGGVKGAAGSALGSAGNFVGSAGNAITSLKMPEISMPTLKLPAPQKQAAQKQQSSQKETFVQGPKREGVVGWLKDELGIIDDKPKQQSPKKKG